MTSCARNRISGAALAAFLVIVLLGCANSAGNPKFDGENAYKLLVQQCDFGPRPPGTAAHRKTGDFIAAHLRQYADQVFEQEFVHNSISQKESWTGRNIFGVFGKDQKRWILLLAHWDTRPFADEEVDEAKAAQPIIGANDGASGCAVLLELARMFHEKSPDVGVVMMFVDGEDYGRTPDEMFLGAKAFAKNWQEVMKPVSALKKFEYGILLDMVGDKDLVIPKEYFSYQSAPHIVKKVWDTAAELGYEEVFLPDTPGTRNMIQDDHLPLLAVGIDCIDIIDFDYAYWHTLEDTPDKCSADSLRIVGEVVAKVVYSEKDESPANP